MLRLGLAECGVEKLQRLHRQQGQVVDQADFLLHERLAVFHAREQAIVAGFGEGALADLVFGNKQGAAGGLVGILRPVGHEQKV